MSRKASDGPRLYKTSETGPLPDTQEGRDEGRPGIALIRRICAKCGRPFVTYSLLLCSRCDRG